MQKIGVLLGVVALLSMPGRLLAQSPDVILGKWLNAKGNAQVEIYKAGGKYFGKIVWLKEPIYPADDRKGMAGKPKVDRENPDPTLRTRPLLNIVLLRNFDFIRDVLWDHGQIYDPESGKDYRCKMRLLSPDALNVRGFIGISIIGRTEIWTRVK